MSFRSAPLRMAGCSLAWLAWASTAAAAIQVEPTTVSLVGNFARSQLQVVEPRGDSPAAAFDVTRQASYRSLHPEIATVDAEGRVTAVADGETTIEVVRGGDSASVAVSVSKVEAQPHFTFNDHVLPILSKSGCNAGECHASQHGKGGFKLSVFGFAPDEDHEMIVRDRQGRRWNQLEPEKSLLLLKGSLAVAHGGGLKLDPKSIDFEILRGWLAGGAPAPKADAAKVTQLTITPDQVVGPVGSERQLRVVATFSDGRQSDVTHWAKFVSLDEGILQVSPTGYLKSIGNGQAVVLARFEGTAAITTVVAPYAANASLVEWQNQTEFDELAAAKFRELGIDPSPLCDDATFVRRVFLDAVGTLPSPAEAQAFIASTDPNKRRVLIDRLLGLTGDPTLDVFNNEYAAYWSLKWADLLRNNSEELGEQGMWALHNWIQGSFRGNKPYDQFVRELTTAKGSIYMSGPANYFRVARDPADQAESTAQIFLGVRLMCAKCHHHPFERYSQEDYYGFAAFFARVGNKTSQEFGLFGQEQVVLVKSAGEVKHPKTGKTLAPTTLDGQTLDDPLDRRLPMATWLTSSENPFFAKNLVNRYLGFVLGSGLVEPIDDLRDTNPASNPPLFDAMAKKLVGEKFNLKLFLRELFNSRIYQLSSAPTSTNAADSRYYSHYYVRRLQAEVLLDAVDAVTGVQTKFTKLPLGTRAIELPDAKYFNHFLDTFGKPVRASVCECERSPDPNLAQSLLLLNGDLLAEKIADPKGRIAKHIAAKTPADDVFREFYWLCYSRQPSDKELAACRDFASQAPDQKTGFEDVLWTLINSKEFLFVH